MGTCHPSLPISILMALVTSAGVFVAVVRSELPPYVYEEWQRYAEYYVQLAVLDTMSLGIRDVLHDPDGYPCFVEDFVALATILRVNRTTTSDGTSPSSSVQSQPQLAAGDNVSFYTWYRNRSSDRCAGFVGPSSPPLLAPGWCGYAYLNSTAGNDGDDDVASTLNASGGGDVPYSLAAGGQSFEQTPCPGSGNDASGNDASGNGTKGNDAKGNDAINESLESSSTASLLVSPTAIWISVFLLS